MILSHIEVGLNSRNFPLPSHTSMVNEDVLTPEKLHIGKLFLIQFSQTVPFYH